MINPPLVSVILPCYNGELYLKAAIDSIINQTYQNLEIIIVDDGSTDSSIDIINHYQANEARIKFIRNSENLGLIKTLNKAISLASGDFIARMDADDISHLSRIEKQIHFLLKNPETEILGSNAISINSKGEMNGKSNSKIWLNSETIRISSLFTQPLFHGSVIGKAEVFKQNPYSESFKHSEDFELWLRIQSQGHQIKNLPESLYYYRQNPDGVSANNTKQQNESHNLASKEHLDHFLEKDIPFTIVCILNNRPSEPVSLKDYRTSVKILKSIFGRTEITDEIREYRISQKINIAIQAAKNADSLKTKAAILVHLFFSSFSKNAIVFLLNKFRK